MCLIGCYIINICYCMNNYSMVICFVIIYNINVMDIWKSSKVLLDFVF